MKLVSGDLAGDLVSQNHTGRGRRAAPNHVLVGAADVRCDHLEYDAVIDRSSGWITKFWIVDSLDLDLAWTKVNDAAI
jgi:hypothetical protein